MNKLADRFKIKYKFVHMMKGASAPIELLADLEYIEERFIELKECYQQLAKKVGEINIASRKGAHEFDVANSLVSYYALSAIHLNTKRDCLLAKDLPPREWSKAELEVKAIADARWEKQMYTGKLSQGKK